MSIGTFEEIQATESAVPLRVLIVEHMQHDVDLALFELRNAGFAVEYTLVENRSGFLKALKEETFDAVLADFRLPEWTGLDALVELKNAGRDIPFLLVTGTLGEEAAVECIKQGVSDYVLKDHMQRLPVALKRSLREQKLRQETAAAALRVSEAKNRDLVEHSIYGICRVSTGGDFLDSNPALLRILGCESPEQLHKVHLFRDVFRFPEQQAKFFQACRQDGQVRGANVEWRRPDGGFVSVRLHLRLLQRKEAESEFELIAEDVTELRAMERQLLQAQKFEAIGQLAGGIAHDFNNVVGAILGWAEIGFDQSAANPQIADRFARIREQGERVAALTRELLAFARRQVLQPRPVDMNSITSGLVTFLDRVIDEDIELKVLTAPLEPIKADPTQIEQVIMNLCINARDAMPAGGRLLVETEMVDLDDSYCRVYPQVVPGRYAVLSISDTGVGMDAETRERIFEPFFTTKEVGKGTGMGLATVYGIVKQHGGFVHVYSEPGQGSLFRVYLPAAPHGAVVDVVTPAQVSPAGDMRGTELILIAEDHESIREMARHALLSLGYKILSAADGEEALRLCERERPALAVLDVVMPRMGGPTAAAQLTQKYPEMPVIFTSGYTRDAARLPAAAPKMTYLQKPYSPTALGKLVRQVLDRHAHES